MNNLYMNLIFVDMSSTTKVQVEKWNNVTDGELNARNLEKKLASKGYSYTKYTFPPGTDFPDHTHEVSKKDALLSGRFKVCMYGQTMELEPGDIVDIPKHTVHNAGVIGSETVTFYDSTKH